jgi:PII-like signaling protein
MTPPTKMLMIFVDESDQWEDLPLYEAILRRLMKFEIAGATVQPGIMGFGSHHRFHHKRLFGVSDDRPMTIIVVDNEAKLRKAIPEIRPLVKEGLLLLTDVEVVPPGPGFGEMNNF